MRSAPALRRARAKGARGFEARHMAWIRKKPLFFVKMMRKQQPPRHLLKFATVAAAAPSLAAPVRKPHQLMGMEEDLMKCSREKGFSASWRLRDIRFSNQFAGDQGGAEAAQCGKSQPDGRGGFVVCYFN